MILSEKKEDTATLELLKVLILVLMDDTLRVTGYICKDAEVKVLILVLMDDTLRVHLQRRRR